MRSSGAWISGAVSKHDIARCGKKPYATHSGNAFRNQWLSVKPGNTSGSSVRAGIRAFDEVAQCVGERSDPSGELLPTTSSLNSSR